jgi:arylsulfatase A-like enzyme
VKRWQRSEYFVDKTLDFLARHKDQPCFVNLWLDDTHTPWIPGAEAPRQDTPKNLTRVLTELDRQIGRLMDGLGRAGTAEDTLLIFASDNGPLPTFGGRRTTGLRGSKLSLYEGGIRLPLIVSWPLRVPTGRVDDKTLIAAVDLLPTICSLAGATIDTSTAARLDGEDMSAALLGQGSARKKPLFWEYGRNREFFSYPKIDRDRSPNLAVRDGKWKLLIDADGTAAQLYDLASDNNETRDLSADEPDVTRRLRAAALAWRKSLPAPANEKSPPTLFQQ